MTAAPTIVEETIEVVPPPGDAPQRQNGATVPVRAQASLDREYVTVGGWGFLHSFMRALSNYIDDITRDFGLDQYERMMTDSQVSSVVKLLVMGVLADAPQLSPPVPEDDERWEEAERIAVFCERNLDRLGRPFVQVLYELVEGALSNGHKVGEQVYELDRLDGVEGAGVQLLLRDIKPKPNRSVTFVVDPYMNVLGLLYVKAGQGGMPLLGVAPSARAEDGAVVPDLIPREKFVVLTHLSRDGDPRGTSALRCIYTPWWVKQQTWREMLAYLARFGSPSIVGNTSAHSEDEVTYDGAGVEITRKTPEEVMAGQLEAIRNGAVGAFPPEAVVSMLQATGKGEPFFQALALTDLQIAKGVLLQTLATEQAEHQARAASVTHQDVLGLLIHFVKGLVIAMIQTDILTPLVRYNFGDAALSLTPTVSLGEVEQQDFSTFANGIASLAREGVLHPSQYPAIWEMLNLPPADEEAWQADQEAAGPATEEGEDEEEEDEAEDEATVPMEDDEESRADDED